MAKCDIEEINLKLTLDECEWLLSVTELTVGMHPMHETEEEKK